jgi:hypothetical protein
VRSSCSRSDCARRAALLLIALFAASACAKRSPLVFDGADRSGGALPSIVALRVGPGAISVDGKLDEAPWQRAASSGPFVDPGHGRPVPASPVNAHARLAWSAEHLYVALVVYDRDPAAPFGRDDVDPHLWERASAIELMLQPGDHGDNRAYYEVQVDTVGAVWDTRFDDYNQPITGAPGQRRFGHQDWRSGLRRAATVDRTAGSYAIELALPWRALAPSIGTRARVPPSVGDAWRMNLYSFRDGQREALAWSPILGQGNFHRASRFGRLRFADR